MSAPPRCAEANTNRAETTRSELNTSEKETHVVKEAAEAGKYNEVPNNSKSNVSTTLLDIG